MLVGVERGSISLTLPDSSTTGLTASITAYFTVGFPTGFYVASPLLGEASCQCILTGSGGPIPTTPLPLLHPNRPLVVTPAVHPTPLAMFTLTNPFSLEDDSIAPIHNSIKSLCLSMSVRFKTEV